MDEHLNGWMDKLRTDKQRVRQMERYPQGSIDKLFER